MIFVDTFEPSQLEELIAQSVPTIRDSFNAKGLPDYSWMDINGFRNGLSRKQAGELLGGIDATEEQLGRDMQGVDRLYLLVEGIFAPVYTEKVGCQIYTAKKTILVPSRKFHQSYTGLFAWFDRLDKSGITVIQTFNWQATAMVLVGLYKSHNKIEEEHTTFKRYIKQKVYSKEKNPQIEALMAIPRTGIGEDRATKLIERFGTFWEVVNQDVEELAKTEDIGMATAQKLFKAIGKYV